MSVAPGVPAGFTACSPGGDFIAVVGPLYLSEGDGVFRLGFRVEPRHTNPMKICHGGMLATFCDMLLPMAAHRHPSVGMRFLATISLQVDYLAMAPLGAWVQGEGQVLRTTRTMVFAQGLVHADDALVARVSGVFKLGLRLDGPREVAG